MRLKHQYPPCRRCSYVDQNIVMKTIFCHANTLFKLSNRALSEQAYDIILRNPLMMFKKILNLFVF